MLSRGAPSGAEQGTSLIEVLVTLLVLSFGLLGVAGLQSKMGLAEMESYQRAQALLALADMTARIDANSSQAAAYVTTGLNTNGTVGTDDPPADCTTLPAGPTRDLCEWSNELKGAAEQKSAANVGGMQAARGCITQLQAPNPALGVCQPGVYQVAVAWQGLNPTKAPALACAVNLYGAGAADANRRVIAAKVSVPTMSCY
jgi:type IV pilus assembly protein PilV